jgi:hypothetical protein
MYACMHARFYKHMHTYINTNKQTHAEHKTHTKKRAGERAWARELHDTLEQMLLGNIPEEDAVSSLSGEPSENKKEPRKYSRYIENKYKDSLKRDKKESVEKSESDGGAATAGDAPDSREKDSLEVDTEDDLEGIVDEALAAYKKLFSDPIFQVRR